MYKDLICGVPECFSDFLLGICVFHFLCHHCQEFWKVYCAVAYKIFVTIRI